MKYPYFQKTADQNDWISGYASQTKKAVSYSWMYTIGEIINALSQAGMHIEWFHEFDWLYFKLPSQNQIKDKDGNLAFPEHKERLPYTFSLKATIR